MQFLSATVEGSMIVLLLFAWMVTALLATFATHLYWRQVIREPTPPPVSGVAVLIPIKGAHPQDAARERFLASCLAQQGVSYRLIFAVESKADPAAAAIARLAAHHPRVTLVVAGLATERGQKVHNQLAALATLRPDDRFVVFVDADLVLAPEFLARLLRPLVHGAVELASGYRWILPADDRFASRLCALMDWSVATAPRSRRWNLLWGGAMAISRSALDRIDLRRCWATTLLDDLVLTRAARRLEMVVDTPRQVLVESPVSHDLRSLFDFGRRQYLFVRVHAPRHWLLAGVTLMVPALAAAVALPAAIDGDMLALGCIVLSLLMQQLRAALRVAIAGRVLPTEPAVRSAALSRRNRWMLPLAHLVHLAIWLTSAFGSTMTWAGTRYRLLGPGRMEILEHDRAERNDRGA
jgi:cellulose synthase/poly-beta-1,6-N-acetylglucosamine synthase-like glycosyltransferase